MIFLISTTKFYYKYYKSFLVLLLVPIKFITEVKVIEFLSIEHVKDKRKTQKAFQTVERNFCFVRIKKVF